MDISGLVKMALENYKAIIALVAFILSCFGSYTIYDQSEEIAALKEPVVVEEAQVEVKPITKIITYADAELKKAVDKMKSRINNLERRH